MPRYSIILTCFNRTQYLAAALESALNQTVTSFEIIVVDDGSEPEAASIIATLCEKEQRIKLIQNHKNTGVSSARNKALSHALGEYVCFLDDDDRLATSFLAYADISFEQQPDADLILCQSAVDPLSNKSLFRYHILKETLRNQPFRRTYSKTNAGLLYHYPPQINSMVFRKQVFKEHQFDPRLTIGEDLFLWLKLLDAGYTFGKKRSAEPLAFVRVHGNDQLSSQGNPQVIHFLAHLKDQFLHWDDSLETVIDFKLFLRYVSSGLLPKGFRALWPCLKKPKYFLPIAFSQGWLKLRIVISYALYKTLKIDL